MRRHTLLCLIVAIASNTCFAQQYGTLKDTRDDKIYKTYKIGECSNDKYNLTLLLSFVKNTDTVVYLLIEPVKKKILTESESVQVKFNSTGEALTTIYGILKKGFNPNRKEDNYVANFTMGDAEFAISLFTHINKDELLIDVSLMNENPRYLYLGSFSENDIDKLFGKL